MMQPYTNAWIGLFRDVWKWSEATNVSTSFITWLTGQPNMVGLQRPCGVSDPSGLIRDQPCSNVLPFLCTARREFYVWSLTSTCTLQARTLEMHFILSSCGQSVCTVYMKNLLPSCFLLVSQSPKHLTHSIYACSLIFNCSESVIGLVLKRKNSLNLDITFFSGQQ